jgi:hypothetical protein
VELRTGRILTLGILGLAAALLLPEISSYVLFPIALAPLILLLRLTNVVPLKD